MHLRQLGGPPIEPDLVQVQLSMFREEYDIFSQSLIEADRAFPSTEEDLRGMDEEEVAGWLLCAGRAEGALRSIEERLRTLSKEIDNRDALQRGFYLQSVPFDLTKRSLNVDTFLATHDDYLKYLDVAYQARHILSLVEGNRKRWADRYTSLSRSVELRKASLLPTLPPRSPR